MSTVFISYRQMSDAHRQRVREFGERLRDCGIDVVLDQFFLDANPGGPDDGWDKWSSDRALRTEYVVIIGTEEWFQCFEKSQPPGTGLGAACEADDLRHRLYEAGGVSSNIRIVLFDDSDAAFIPAKLKRYHRFHAERDFANVARWLGGAAPDPYTQRKSSRRRKSSTLRRQDNPFQTSAALSPDHVTYIRRQADDEYERVLDGPDALISITGEFGIGKSSMMQQARRILPDSLFFGGAMADMGGHDEARFMRNIFKLFSKHFGPVSDWDELDEHVRLYPSVLLLDDIGEVAAPGLEAFIPALVDRLSRSGCGLRAIATSPTPLRSVFSKRGLENPRYSKPWKTVHVITFDEHEANHLLQLLPPRALAVAMKHINTVERLSGLAPQRLQCLCHSLFNGECDGLSDEQLSAIIAHDSRYQ